VVAPGHEVRSNLPVVPLVFTAIASAGIRPTSLSLKGPLQLVDSELSRVSNWELLDLSGLHRFASKYDIVDGDGRIHPDSGFVNADLIAKILKKFNLAWKV
jgi:hypothetical protein